MTRVELRLEAAATARFTSEQGAFVDDPNPLVRRLQVYAQDPSIARYDGAVTTVEIPWEPLPGAISGRLFEVIDHDASAGVTWRPADLDHHRVLANAGFDPSTTDPRFAQQMVYALAMKTFERFERALGRQPTLANGRLILRPHAEEAENAWYDPNEGALNFGYFAAHKDAPGRSQGGARVKTALSHDIVIHEITHALIDGLRSHFLLPSNGDVLALHEGLCDLVALFSRFANVDLVARALRQSKGELEIRTLYEVARQFGQTKDGKHQALRSAILDFHAPDSDIPAAQNYANRRSAHDRGEVLVSAVFEAFRVVFQRRTEPERRLAQRLSLETHGLPEPLNQRLAETASRLAAQFLNLIIRAIDYTPPVDCTFGEYLRALITADTDAESNDRFGYREALVAAFRRYGITVAGVPDLSEDALRWRAPEPELPMPLPTHDQSEELVFHSTNGHYDPLRSARTAKVLVDWLNQLTPEQLKQLGLVAPDGSDHVSKIAIHSVRTLRRINPDRSRARELVVELIQQRVLTDGMRQFGGATLILNAERIRCAIVKSVDSERRAKIQASYLQCEGALYRPHFAAREKSTASFDLQKVKHALALKLHQHGLPWCQDAEH
jgi:hypothetical protein